MKHFYKYKLAYIWSAFILFLCTVNPSSLPDIDFTFKFGKDKLAHFILFGVQSLCIMFPHIGSNNNKHYINAFSISTIYGIGIEIIQGLFFANRTFDYADMLANTIGAAFFVCVFLMFRLARKYQLI